MSLEILFTVVLPLIITAAVLVRNKRVGLELLLILLFSIGLSVFLKNIFKVNPVTSSQGFQLSQYAFPSLSTLLVTTFWGQMFVRFKKSYLLAFGMLAVFGIAYYKIISSQHTIAEIVGGVAIGAMVLLIYNYGRAIRSK